MTLTEKPARPFWPLAVLLLAATLIYCAPLFTHLDRWGRQDWDQFTFRFATPRAALLRDHVWPTWNPYANGGTVLLAHPDSPVLSPWFLIVLLLDAPLGLRVQVAVFMAIGAIGMAAFLRRLGSNRAGCLAGGIVFMMSSHFALQITEGHLEWCVIGLMPWLAWCLHRAQDDRRFIVVAALLLASVLTFGAVHIPAVYLPFLSVWVLFEAVRRRQWQPLVHWGAVVIVAALLSSAKLLPTLAFSSSHPREAELGGFTPPVMLPTMFADPRQAFFYKARRDRELEDGHFAKAVDEARAAPFLERWDRAEMRWKFHEYGCYLGAAGIVLAIIGLATTGRRFWPLYAAGGLSLVVVLGASSPVDLWARLQQLPLYEQFRVPSRFLAAIVFVLAVATAAGMTALAGRFKGSRQKWRRPVQGVLVGLLFGELVVMGWSLFGDIFVVPRVELPVFTEFAQRSPPPGGPELYPEVMDSNMHAYFMTNSGTLEAYENLAVPKGAVKTVGEPGYRGEAYLESGQGVVEVQRWTMSTIVLRATAKGPDSVIINQNFDAGWKARSRDSAGTVSARPTAASSSGLISVPIDAGPADLELFYRPAGLVLGVWISGSTLVLCLLVLVVATRKRASASASARRAHA